MLPRYRVDENTSKGQRMDAVRHVAVIPPPLCEARANHVLTGKARFPGSSYEGQIRACKKGTTKIKEMRAKYADSLTELKLVAHVANIYRDGLSTSDC